MNRFFTLLLAAYCFTSVGQDWADGVCCDVDSFYYLGEASCNSSPIFDGEVSDDDCADFVICQNEGACNDGSFAECYYPPQGFDCSGNCALNINSSYFEITLDYVPSDGLWINAYGDFWNYVPNISLQINGAPSVSGILSTESFWWDEYYPGVITVNGTLHLLHPYILNFGAECGENTYEFIYYPPESSGCAAISISTGTFETSCGCSDENACNYSGESVFDFEQCLYLDNCGVCDGPGAIYECGCNNVPEGDCDCNGNQLDAVDVCGGSCLEDDDDNGVCDDQEVYGCTYPLAQNFSSSVTRDDGSCIFPCEGVVNTNVFDWDGDYVVTVTDFLMMLSVYGDTDVDLDGVWDSGDECVDSSACNYASDPSEPCTYIDILGVCGGGCEADEDNDGICDDIDTCIGIEDECGVCNGPGPTEVVVEDIVITYDSVYLPLDNDWYVFPISADTTFSYTCAPFFADCGDPVSYQGYDYTTVLIGEQCWFAENLRSENYENGDVIPSNLSGSEWSSTTSGAVAVYGEGSSSCYTDTSDVVGCDEAWSLIEYGRLYNWYAVDDARGLCPSGWHVPTDEEWTVVTDVLGGESVAGGQMKTTYGWNDGGNGTNSSGFSGLPGGYRGNGYGNFFMAPYKGYWWSSSPSGSDAWNRTLYSYVGSVGRSGGNLRFGFSVRCVRDAE